MVTPLFPDTTIDFLKEFSGQSIVLLVGGLFLIYKSAAEMHESIKGHEIAKKEKYDVYIGRPSIWGNPFVIGKDGDRNEVIRKYEKYVRNNKTLQSKLIELDGKILGCWCSPLPCHGDVLIKLIEEKSHKEGKQNGGSK
jgi:hypothetical protein